MPFEKIEKEMVLVVLCYVSENLAAEAEAEADAAEAAEANGGD